jgi:hypothetical protein
MPGGPCSIGTPPSLLPSPHTSGAPGGTMPVCAGKHAVKLSRHVVIAAVVVAACKQLLKALKQSTALECVAVAVVVALLSRLDVALSPLFAPAEQPTINSEARLNSTRRRALLRMRSSLVRRPRWVLLLSAASVASDEARRYSIGGGGS